MQKVQIAPVASPDCLLTFRRLAFDPFSPQRVIVRPLEKSLVQPPSIAPISRVEFYQDAQIYPTFSANAQR